MSNLNFTSLAVLPSDGQLYNVLNVGTQNHCFNNAVWGTANGNPVLSYACNAGNETNQKWSFRAYPSCNDDTAFTLQVLNVMQSNPAGGYLRADQATNKLVIGQPQAWKLIQVSPLLYKIAPFESFLYGDGSLVITDVHEKSEQPNWQLNQMQLQEDTTSPQQLWMFQ